MTWLEFAAACTGFLLGTVLADRHTAARPVRALRTELRDDRMFTAACRGGE